MSPSATPNVANGAPKTQKERNEAKRAKEIWNKAEEVLKHVDSAYIVANNKTREFPKFKLSEVEAGPLLGKGGFSGVKEVLKLVLEGEDGTGASAVEDEEDEEEQEAALLKRGGAGDEEHYSVDTARSTMAKRCIRYGSARYAIKKLKPELGVVDLARGALDLAIEIKYMSVIWHPNIGKSYCKLYVV